MTLPLPVSEVLAVRPPYRGHLHRRLWRENTGRASNVSAKKMDRTEGQCFSLIDRLTFDNHCVK